MVAVPDMVIVSLATVLIAVLADDLVILGDAITLTVDVTERLLTADTVLT